LYAENKGPFGFYCGHSLQATGRALLFTTLTKIFTSLKTLFGGGDFGVPFVSIIM